MRPDAAQHGSAWTRTYRRRLLRRFGTRAGLRNRAGSALFNTSAVLFLSVHPSLGFSLSSLGLLPDLFVSPRRSLGLIKSRSESVVGCLHDHRSYASLLRVLCALLVVVSESNILSFFSILFLPHLNPSPANHLWSSGLCLPLQVVSIISD